MSLFKVGKYWYYEFQLGGEKYRASTKMTRKSDAALVEAEVKRQAMKDLLMPPGATKMSLKEGYERISHERYAYNRDSLKSLKRLKTCIEIIGESKYIHELTNEDLQKVKKEISRNRKPVTVNRYLTAIKTLINDAKRDWGVQCAADIRRMRETREEKKCLTEEDEEWCMENLKSPFRDLFVLLLDTGMRLSEAVVHLKVGNFDPIRKRIYLPGTSVKGGAGRSIPLTDRAYDVLVRRSHGRKKGTFFPFKDRDYVSRQMAKKLPGDFTAHSLRHTFCARLIQGETNMYIVQQLMGHSNIKVTEKYAHASFQALRSAIDKTQRNSKGFSKGSRPFLDKMGAGEARQMGISR